MSRVIYNDEGDVYGILAAGRWEANRDRVRRSKRGKAALTQLLTDLEAWPSKKLAADTFCEVREGGEVKACVMGVYELARGKDPDELRSLNNADADETAYSLRNEQLSFQLIWMLVEENDEFMADKTDEERYESMVELVKKWLALPAL